MPTTKIFKSGNAMAVRLPAAFKAVAGTPVEVREEHGRWIVEPAAAPKRPGKVDLTGVYGSVPGMKPIASADRVFEDRPSARLAKQQAGG